jgi:hypothetical protein
LIPVVPSQGKYVYIEEEWHHKGNNIHKFLSLFLGENPTKKHPLIH